VDLATAPGFTVPSAVMMSMICLTLRPGNSSLSSMAR